MRDSKLGRRDFLRSGMLAGAAIFASSRASTAAATPEASMSDLSADEIRSLLKLEPNQTCGFVRETYTSALSIAPGGLPAPFADGRPAGTALYFLMTPQAPVKLHRIMNDQLYHYYLGDPIEVLMLLEDGSHKLAQAGPDIRDGQQVQLFIPGGTFHTARLLPDGKWFLGGSSEWPGVVVREDVELGDVEALAAKYPEVAEQIRAFPVPAKI
jgi:uncharacterized protein